jgi:hypothetical protein
MAENETNKRLRGQRCKNKEVKTEIIKYILNANTAVSGSEIRAHLRVKYGITDTKNIKTHLEQLKKNNCIEKFKLTGDDFGNEWDITKFENLQKIGELFPEIQQNESKKWSSIMPIEEIRKYLDFLSRGVIEDHLRASKKYYDMWLKGDFKTVYSQTCEYYRLTEGYEEDQFINKSINDVCADLIKEKNISLDIETWKKSLQKIVEKYFFNLEIKAEGPLHKSSGLEMCRRMAEGLINNLDENSNLLNCICEKTRKGIPAILTETIYSTPLNNFYESMCEKIIEIMTRQERSRILCYYMLFKSHVLQDFQNNVESDQEKKFISKLDKFLTKFTNEQINDPAKLYIIFDEYLKNENSFCFPLNESHFDQKD